LAGTGARASGAWAAADVVRGTTGPTAFGEGGLADDCRPGITGELAGSEVINFQTVETSKGFHSSGTVLDTGRIDWSDGSYTVIGSRNHFSFTVGPNTTVSTLAHEDSGKTYSATGQFLFRLTFHSVERFTLTGGVPHAEFERGHFHVFGSC
jgi:hypothetical protein